MFAKPVNTPTRQTTVRPDRPASEERSSRPPQQPIALETLATHPGSAKPKRGQEQQIDLTRKAETTTKQAKETTAAREARDSSAAGARRALAATGDLMEALFDRGLAQPWPPPGALSSSNAFAGVMATVPEGPVISIGHALARRDFAEARARFEALIHHEMHKFDGEFFDPMMLVQEVMKEAYLSTKEDLAMRRQKVQAFNTLRQVLREQLRGASQTLSVWKETLAADPNWKPDPYLALIAQMGRATNGDYEPQAVAYTFDEAAEHGGTVGTNGAPGQDDAGDGRRWEVTDVTSQNWYKTYSEGADQSAIDDRATEAANDLVGWFRGLSTAEKQAVIEYWKTEGLKLSGSTDWGDGGDERIENEEGHPRMDPGQDPVAFIEESLGAFAALLMRRTASKRGESGEINDIRLNVYVPKLRELPPEPSSESQSTTTENSGPPSASPSEYPVIPGEGTPIDSVPELEQFIKTVEEQIAGAGEDAELANIDLQNVLQKQQQTLNMLSNISKMLHDTAMAIIRKVG
jgi:hypothetical protein